jgi:hypothetical protein
MKTELHFVIEAQAVTSTTAPSVRPAGGFTYRAVSPALSFDDAISVWTELDYKLHQEAQRYSALKRGDYFMVRSVDDPKWSFLLDGKCGTPTLPKAFKQASRREHTSATDAVVRAAKLYAKEHGIGGAKGGWIYYPGSNRTICQGWHSYAEIVLRKGALRTLPSSRYDVKKPMGIRSGGVAWIVTDIFTDRPGEV